MKSFQSAILILVFSATVFLAYTYLIQGSDPVGPDSSPINNTGFLKTEQEFKDKLAQLRLEREKVVRRKKLLDDRKAETVELLKSKGFTAESDLDNEDTKYAVRDLNRYVADMQSMDETIKKYDKPIAAIEAMLKRIEQDQIAAEVAISSEKAEELGIMLLDLDERLGVKETDMFEEQAIRKILSSELGDKE